MAGAGTFYLRPLAFFVYRSIDVKSSKGYGKHKRSKINSSGIIMCKFRVSLCLVSLCQGPIYRGRVVLLLFVLGASTVSPALAEKITQAQLASRSLDGIATCYNGAHGVQDVATACRQIMRTAISHCLEIKSNTTDAVLACAGRSAKVCQKTTFATTIERSALCIDTEANIWAARLQSAYLALTRKIDQKARRQMRSAYLSWKAHMDQTCRLRQTILSAPDAWIEVADCRLHMLARQAQEFQRLERYLLAKQQKGP